MIFSIPLFTIIFKPKMVVSRIKILVNLFQPFQVVCTLQIDQIFKENYHTLVCKEFDSLTTLWFDQIFKSKVAVNYQACIRNLDLRELQASKSASGFKNQNQWLQKVPKELQVCAPSAPVLTNMQLLFLFSVSEWRQALLTILKISLKLQRHQFFLAP